MPRHTLSVEPLTAAAFLPFGDVIEATAGIAHHAINDGHALRFDALADIDTARAGGRPRLSIFRASPRVLPLHVTLVERHRLGSQLFMPLAPQRFLVVVAEAGARPTAPSLRAFLAGPGQGINLRPGTWHHPLLALDDGGDFLVIDRAADESPEDCEVCHLAQATADVWIAALA
jgi:ureidoglycolate lyase